jgi:hypothetical protein
MSRPRSTEILAQWQQEAHAATLAVHPPRPARRGVPIGVAGTFVAAVVVIGALAARGSGPPSPGQPNGGVGADPSAGGSVSEPASSPTDVAASLPAESDNPAASPSQSVSGPICTADQLVLGNVTIAPGYGALGTDAVYVTQSLRNAGEDCVFNVPETIGVSSTGGQFQMVTVQNTAISPAVGIPSGATASIVLGTWWWVSGHASGRESAPPCSDVVEDVSRVSIPQASGTIEVDLGTVWREVCTTPASVSITVTG